MAWSDHCTFLVHPLSPLLPGPFSFSPKIHSVIRHRSVGVEGKARQGGCLPEISKVGPRCKRKTLFPHGHLHSFCAVGPPFSLFGFGDIILTLGWHLGCELSLGGSLQRVGYAWPAALRPQWWRLYLITSCSSKRTCFVMRGSTRICICLN